MDVNSTYGKKAWRQLHKNAASYTEHVPEAATHKAAAIRPLTTITKTIQIRRHCWRSRDELISDVFLWTSSHGRTKAGQPAKTYIQQLSADTGCSLEYLPEAGESQWVRWRDMMMMTGCRLLGALFQWLTTLW